MAGGVAVDPDAAGLLGGQPQLVAGQVGYVVLDGLQGRTLGVGEILVVPVRYRLIDVRR